MCQDRGARAAAPPPGAVGEEKNAPKGRFEAVARERICTATIRAFAPFVCAGPNGSGKSTLLKLITGEVSPPEGEVRRNPRLRIGVYNQHFVDRLPMEEDPVTYLRRLFNEESYQSVRNMLGRYGLEGHAHTIPMRDLSGGQKARVVFVERWRLVRVGNAFAPTATANHPRALRLLLFAAQRWFGLESTTVAIAPHEEVVVVRVHLRRSSSPGLQKPSLLLPLVLLLLLLPHLVVVSLMMRHLLVQMAGALGLLKVTKQNTMPKVPHCQTMRESQVAAPLPLPLLVLVLVVVVLPARLMPMMASVAFLQVTGLALTLALFTTITTTLVNRG